MRKNALARIPFGSTKSGIAPFYSDKFSKIGFQVSELFDEELLNEKVRRICDLKNPILEYLYHKPVLDAGRTARGAAFLS